MACQSASATASGPSNIPPFAQPLAPYIKTRQEALHIRQVLTSYLRSHIIFADNDPEHPDCHAQSHLSLSVSDNAVTDVKRVPADVTGLRREYLQALQANVAARKQHHQISEKLDALHSERSKFPGSSPDSSSELQAYLRLVRDRRRHAKLQVFEHYFNELRARDTPRPEDFEKQEDQEQFTLPEGLGDEDQDNGVAGGDSEELVHKLERAVIRAKSQLDRERELYAELKARNASEGDRAEKSTPAVKAAALQQTRDELVQWVEDKLVGSGNGEEDPVEELPTEEIEESARILEEQRVRILEQYRAYTETRKRLLEAAARACQPVSTASTKSPPRPPELKGLPSDETLPLEPLEVLSYASNVLHPISKSQRSLALQKFYLTGLLAKEKSTTLRVLNRLRDESHLLPEYPILARQPRFKHAAAALNSRHAAGQQDPVKQDEIVNMAEAWAFASAAAGSNEKEYVEQKVGDGNESADNAQEELQNVYNLLNQDLEEALKDRQGDDQKDGDLWAHEARSSRSQARMSRSEKRPKGPWTRLNGKVGVAD
ncbi:hypothetical protein ASPVEDRAFT_624429 [Aspergillus versicolor CBS 583.65]|uniref:Uncharacterized protein n=1 Tax=Aspergillus versicolor CBS 583.65 TaxID=1036611 RepID=A0A1L9PIB3_ASPVE|nr:uncharacterized protein ASPVEDRAFT_624429 [Aspergillus versicolor CBS 583.65]OJJ01248.1 hypothetical protein ASPVEDRAFT_624429 [Aspergillus versicolor CBS 583.65]